MKSIFLSPVIIFLFAAPPTPSEASGEIFFPSIQTSLEAFAIEPSLNRCPPSRAFIVSPKDFQSIMTAVKKEAFDSNRTGVLQNYVRKLQSLGLYFSGSQIMDLCKIMTWDDGRLDTLRIARPVSIIGISDIDPILDTFTFDSNKDEARDLLLQ